MLTHLFLTGCSAMIYHSHMRKPGTDRLRYLQEFHSLSAAASGFESDFTPVFSTTISPGLSLLCGASFLVSVSLFLSLIPFSFLLPPGLSGDSVFAMTLIKSEEIISFKLQARGSLFWERSWNAQLLLGTFKRLFCIHRMVKRGEKAKKKKK